MSAKTVFISYSHHDEAWKDKLVPQLQALEQAGVGLHVWHDRKIDGGDKWYPEIETAMDDAAAAILLISSSFLSSKFCVQEEVPALLKRQEEQGMLLIPVLLRPCVWGAHRWLKDRQMLPRDGKSVAVDYQGDLSDEVFAAVAAQIFGHFEQLPSGRATSIVIPPDDHGVHTSGLVNSDPSLIATTPVTAWPVLVAASIDLTRLPETGSALFGRDDELELLDHAWASAEQAHVKPTRVLAFTAHGGVGKSTLVNHWLAEMARDNYRGATRVFGWSFYSQGVREETAASADTFIDAALRFFGDSDPTAGSPWDKGERLARLVGSQRALLVLDGMEPLQSAYEFERGKVRDPALESLLRGLARQSAGLCLITTRESLPDLTGRSGVESRDLEQINVQAGRALLRTARVVGTDAELEDLARRFGPHALAISLLGVYLREQPGHGIGPGEMLEQLPGEKPINRVLAGFEQWLGKGPELEALRLLGFFDRPADGGCLRALRNSPLISGLTKGLSSLNEADWDRVLDRLQKLRLIHVLDSQSGKQFVDAHPLIREHFAQLLKGKDGWREGHRRIYEHLCATTKEGEEPTLEELQPLYQAVAHGCQAGLQQETCDEVYFARISRGNEAYATSKLGAFGSDLGAVAHFFETPWIHVSSSLMHGDQAWLLNQAAFRLRALGRLTEALKPMRAALEMRIKEENWQEAANFATNLSNLELTSGDVSQAVHDAEQSVVFAGQSQDAFWRMGARSYLGDALHKAGRRPEAEAHFHEAETLQAEIHPNNPLLYGVAGFYYCDLLLAKGERAAWQTILQCRDFPLHAESLSAVHDRAGTTLRVAQDNKLSLLSTAVDYLTLGRAALYAAILEESAVRNHKSEIEAAVASLRRASSQDLIPSGLLTRAWLRSLTDARIGPASAQSDLDEAWEIAERGPMQLFMADIHLYRARLFHSVKPYPWTSPQEDLAAARKLIEQCGYWRRKEELEDAEAAAKNW
jgi:tetratricopeptide (TPR) repeat protein